MNPVYGVRFRASFKSEENWYAINEYGGKVLLVASFPIAAYGLSGAILNKNLPYSYISKSSLFITGILLIALAICYMKANKIDEQRSAEKSEENSNG